jgi:hypothetical protein
MNNSVFVWCGKAIKKEKSTKPRNDFFERETTSTLAPMHMETSQTPLGRNQRFLADPVRHHRRALRALALSSPHAHHPASVLPLQPDRLLHRQLLPVSECLLHASSRLLRRQLVLASARLLPAHDRLIRHGEISLILRSSCARVHSAFRRGFGLTLNDTCRAVPLAFSSRYSRDPTNLV